MAGRPLTQPLYDWTLTGMFRDLNGDLAPDLYACSDMASPDRIWINRGDGRFQAVARTAFRKTSWFSMGVDCADLDRDGYDEVFVTDMVSREHRLRQVQISDHQLVFSQAGVFHDRPQAPRNTLFRSCGDGDYLEIAYAAGLDASEWSWSPVFLDVDLDGFEDVLIATGFERDVQDIDIANQLEAIRRDRRLSDLDALRMRARFPRLALPNLAFRNRGNLTFEEIGKTWGFDTPGVSQGVALADLDNDGDLDVIVNNMNDAAGLYRNESAAPRLAVRLKGTGPNTHGIGAKVRVFDPILRPQSQEMQAGGRYLSSDDSLRVFAASHATNQLRVEINWRDGHRSLATNLPANSLVELDEASAPSVAIVPPAAAPAPLFENLSPVLNHVHQDQDFDDFARQPLLPRKLSQLGPSVVWADLDADGWDDLVIGSGRGGKLAAYHNDTRGGFAPLRHPALARSLDRDLAGILVLPHPQLGSLILAGESNYEDLQPQPSRIQFIPIANHPTNTLPFGSAAIGPLAAADLDGDGALELFAGGRAAGGRYPEPAKSRLYRWREGALVEDPATAVLFDQLGLVSGAVFADLEGDGFPELVLACDWGPVRLFRNTRGRLTPWVPALLWPPSPVSPNGQGNAQTNPTALDQLTGWWNGIGVGDFDGDGRLDLLASNWGQNHKYQAHRTQPLRLYYGDFTEAGGVDLVEAYYEPPLNKIVPWMHLGRFGLALPSVASRYPTFRQFGTAGIPEILGDQFARAQVVQAAWLETTLFLNRTNGFLVRVLPAQAQWSPAFAVCVADFDGDGAEDAFLSQNFFATEPETGRYDGGRGLLLRGNGSGDLNPMPGRESGIIVYGEQRGAAVSDYDADGRADLVVSQNGTTTQLFHNRGARPGLRVRLRGPSGNPAAIGAVLRLRFADHAGPAREIHAGSGYWSQDSSVAVMATPEPPVALEIRWPGGATTTTPVPAEARSLEVSAPGVASTP